MELRGGIAALPTSGVRYDYTVSLHDHVIGSA